MCGILGVVAQSPVNQLLYDGLLTLQHRGQDASGIVTAQHNTFHMHKGLGMVRDVFRTRNMRALVGNMGIGHVRYPICKFISRSATILCQLAIWCSFRSQWKSHECGGVE